MSYIVALTGGIGSGKTTIANMFAKFNVAIIDADEIARQMVKPGMPALSEIATHFGDKILSADGSLNRKALRLCIFNNEVEKQWVNNLLHPLIRQETEKLLKEIQAPYILWVIPLLIENNLVNQANRILVVDVPIELQISRTMLRDKINHQLALQIIKSQVSREQRLSYADDVIDNSGDASSIIKQVEILHQRYLQLATEHNQIVFSQ